MATKLYKSLTEYRRCFTDEDIEQAKKDGFKDVSNFLNVTPEPEFTPPTPTEDIEVKVESPPAKTTPETEKDLEHRFVNMYKGKKAFRAGKRTKLFDQYCKKHGL